MPDLSDLTSQCIRCGFCLESCPTFLITGDESQGPRGRIKLAREAAWDSDTYAAIDSCLGCRNCETACPSGVKYGEILELARAELEPKHGRNARKQLLMGLTDFKKARVQFGLASFWPGDKMPGFLSRAVSGQSPEARIPGLPNPTPWPPLEERDLPAIQGEVYLLEGCVMRVLYPDVHEATRRLLRRIGFAVRESEAGCCGALHAHSGHLEEAELRAQELAKQMPDDLPIIVNSAGCGSTMKEYGHVIGQGLEQTAKRTYDITEFLLANGLMERLSSSPGLPNITLTYHDACHLAHGQKVTSPPRELLAVIPGATLIDLPESDLCCGSAGTYNIFQPQMARKLLDRKWSHIEDTKAHIAVMGNPGCQGWIQQAADESGSVMRVMHTADVLESAFSGIRAR